ncbi:MAG: hypothetical protein H8E25_05135 [Planctomycetes bacterium]|nr:hypothetical protein [Planctomycetota bacterium]
MSPQPKGTLALIYERLYVIVVITAVAMLAALFVTESLSKTYRSQARCYLPSQSDTLSLSDEASNLPTVPKLPTANSETQTSLLGVLNSAELRAAVATQIDERNSEWLKENVKFDLDTYNFIVITAYDPEPRVARKVAEVYLREFRSLLDAKTKQTVAGNVQTLVAAIDRSTTAVSELETQRQEFLATNGSINFSTEIAQNHSRVNRFREALENNESSSATLIKQREEVIKNFESRPEFSQSGYTEVNNPRINQLQTQISSAQLELEGMKLVYKEKSPEIIALVNKLELLAEQLNAETLIVEGGRSFSSDSLRNTYQTRLAEFNVNEATLAVQHTHYSELLSESQIRLRELNTLKAQGEALDSELRTIRATLSQQRDRHAELELYLSRTASFLMTSEAPVEATKPYFPILWINLLAAAFFGIVSSIIVVVISEQITRYKEAAPW